MTSFLLSTDAEKDLEDITNYLLENTSKATATTIICKVFDAFQKLSLMPEIGHLRQDLVSEPVLFWQVKPYLIIYKSNTEPLEIVRVLHSSRDISDIIW